MNNSCIGNGCSKRLDHRIIKNKNEKKRGKKLEVRMTVFFVREEREEKIVVQRQIF